MATNRDQSIKYFISNNGTETRHPSLSVESCAPTQETSEITSHPCAKPYATSAEVQMWAAVDMLKQLEVKLRPIYDGLMHQDLTHEKSESLEQQEKILQACQTILEIVTVMKERKISDQPSGVGPQRFAHSWCPDPSVYKVCDDTCTHNDEVSVVCDINHGYQGV